LKIKNGKWKMKDGKEIFNHGKPGAAAPQPKRSEGKLPGGGIEPIGPMDFIGPISNFPP
jgi:hypothetical protein